MDWDNIRIFLGVARAGQFLAAGRLLHLDHATVSRRIGAIEADLKVRLFERRSTGVVLTEAGERLLETAERMESDLLRVQAELSRREVELSGTVRIGAPDGFSTFYLTRCLAGFVERHPAIAVQIVPMPQVLPLARREVDIVIVLEKPDAGRFLTRKLTDYSLGIYASRGYLAAHPAPRDQTELLNHRLIGYVTDYAFSPALDYVRELFEGARTTVEAASAVGQLEAIRSGMGLGVVHDFIARDHPDLVRVLPERGAWRSYWIVTHEDVRGLGRIEAAHAHIVSAIEADRSRFLSR